MSKIRRAKRTPLGKDEALLVVVQDAKRRHIESVTVFTPYRDTPPPGAGPEWYASRYESAWGPVDITYSFGVSYLMLRRTRTSGFYTGVPHRTETITRHPSRQEAVTAAKVTLV